jgi:hypothetical protein
MSDPDDINFQRYIDGATRPLSCPECGGREDALTKPDEDGVVDCQQCGSWFWVDYPDYDAGVNCDLCYGPTINGHCAGAFRPACPRHLQESADPGSLSLKLRLAQAHPRAEDQLEERGFTRKMASVWTLSVDPAWEFDVRFSKDDEYWFLRIVWKASNPIKVAHFEPHHLLPALLFDVDSHVRKLQGRRLVSNAERLVVENAASLPLAYGLLEIESDFYQPALPFDPAVSLGQASQRKMPFDPPVPASYAPVNNWQPPPRAPTDPDDFDLLAYIDSTLCRGERRIATSFSKITWHDPPDEDYDEENGWEDEEGEDLAVDEFDDDDATPVKKAVKWLRNKGAQDTGNDGWYSSEEEQNYRDGSRTTYSYHLRGYTEDELNAIHELVARPRRWQESADPDDPEAFMTRFHRGKPIKKVEVYGRRWFSSGNTYHTVEIYVDDKLVATIPQTYGYGNQYVSTARDWLSSNNYLMAHRPEEPLWRIADNQGFNLSASVEDVKRKKYLHRGK